VTEVRGLNISLINLVTTTSGNAKTYITAS